MPVTTLKAFKLFPAPVHMATALDSVVGELKIDDKPMIGVGDLATVTKQTRADAWTAWKTGLTAPKLILFTNSPGNTENVSYADLVRPTGAWYADKAIVMDDIYELPDGTLEFYGPSKQWNHDGAAAAEDIAGVALIDTI